MRLLHTADLHLGKVLHEQSMLDDQAHILDQIATELESGSYNLFLVAGDVFDRSVPPPEAVVLWDSFLVRIAACADLKVFVIAGNHDGAVRLSWSARFLAERGIYVATRAEDLATPVTVSVGGQEWDIFSVPFLQAGTLPAAPPPSSETEPGVLRSQRDLWEEALKRLHAARRGVPSLLIAHLFTSGGAESDSERVFLGEAEQIPAPWLAGWDYVALGHLHQAQEPHPGVRYSGSPLAYSFSEAGQQKVMLRWDNGAVTAIPLVPRRPLTRLKGTYEQLSSDPELEACREHWLEISLSDAALVSNAMERLRPRFPHLLSLRQAPAEVVSSTSPLGRQSGDLESDTIAFLTALGHPGVDDLRPLVSAAVKEVLDETP